MPLEDRPETHRIADEGAGGSTVPDSPDALEKALLDLIDQSRGKAE